METHQQKGRTFRRKAVVALVGTLLLFIVVLFPFALTSVTADLLQSSNPIYRISPQLDVHKVSHTAVHLDIIDVNQWEGTIKIRASAHDSCSKNCDWEDHILFVSLLEDKANPGDIDPSRSITFPASARDITEDVELPIFGDPIRYPFDNYRIGLGVIMERIYKDGTVQRLTPQEAREHLIVTMQPRIPRLVMNQPIPLENLKNKVYGELEEEYAYGTQLTFSRPLYMKILTVLLVLLISAAAAYAVFMGPLHDLLINSGALVLGVWGVRAILLGSDQPGITAADLVLAIVVLFLLMAITVRGVDFLDVEQWLPIFRRKKS